MRLLKSKIVRIAFLAALFGVSFYFTYQYLQPFQKVKIKNWEIRIKPNARVDPAKKYQITLWDYDWPLQGGNYREYLQKQVQGFNQSYPNIKVELRLLDLLTGPAELTEALRQGRPPDVYCSALVTPGFNFKYQVPVGPYLEPKACRLRYFLGITRLTKIDGVQCYFPRWVRPSLWVGNRQLLEQAGLSVAKIQTQGWNWEEVLSLRAKLPRENYPLVGKGVPEAVLQKIGSREGLANPGGAEWELLQKIRDVKGVPVDYNAKMLEYFIAGRAGALAEVKPIIWRYLRERLASSGAGWEPVCLPVPALSAGKPAQTVELGVISVYRTPHQTGYEQVAAALKLGEYLSLCHGDSTPWTEMMLIPAARAAAANWFAKAAQTGDNLKILEQELTGGSLRPALFCQVRLGKIDAVVQKFLTGALSQAATVERLQMELAGE